MRHFERREGVYVDLGHSLLGGATDREVGFPGKRRMDATLHADLGRAACPRLAYAPADLGQLN